jgi:predicted Fe-Mo cluster-binding NifX family protein
MRFAIAVDGDQVSAHFGRCERYELVDLRDGQGADRRSLANPGHAPGELPPYLRHAGVDCIVAGGMGPRAVGLFESLGIGVIVGVTGPVEDAVRALVEGRLEGGDSLCDH